MRFQKFAPALMGFLLLALPAAAAKTELPPAVESRAYAEFTKRPVSELSKILYLLDRFNGVDLEIIYDDHFYKGPFASRVARWFLAHKYRRQKATEWVLEWCYRSIGGKLIFVKMQDGSLRLSRDILLDELKTLDSLIAAKQKPKAP